MMSTQHHYLASVRCQHHASRSSRSSIRLTSSTHQDLSALNSFWFDIWMNSVLDIFTFLMIAIARSTTLRWCPAVVRLSRLLCWSLSLLLCSLASLLCLQSLLICGLWWLSSHTSFARRPLWVCATAAAIAQSLLWLYFSVLRAYSLENRYSNNRCYASAT